MFRRISAWIIAARVMRQTLKQPCWFSLFRARQSTIPVLENPLKPAAHTQQLIDVLIDVLEFVLRDSPNPLAGNFSTITHSQDGCQLRKRKAHPQRTLDQSNAVKGVCRVISITAVGAGRFRQNSQTFVMPQSVGAYPD
jgi:hypothetical protein